MPRKRKLNPESDVYTSMLRRYKSEEKNKQLDDNKVSSDSEEETWEDVDLPVNSTLTEDLKPLSLNLSNSVSSKPKTSKSPGITKLDREIRQLIHKVHVLTLLAHGKIVNAAISCNLLKALCLSVLPTSFSYLVFNDNSSAISQRQTVLRRAVQHPIQFKEKMVAVATWWKNSFTIISEDPKAVEAQTYHQQLIAAMNLLSGTEKDFCVLFCCLLRSIGIICRLVGLLHPIPLKISKEDDSITHDIIFWIEIDCPGEKGWIILDPRSSKIKKGHQLLPTIIQYHRGKGNDKRCSGCLNPAYIVAFESEISSFKDVTPRYTTKFISRSLKLRPPYEQNNDCCWWDETMVRLGSQTQTEKDHEEEKELLSAMQKEPMPTCIGDYNNHPLYVIEKHLKKFEVIYPKEPVLGVIGGEKVYLRSCLKKALSAEKWLNEARVIKSGEVPIKEVNSKGNPSNEGYEKVSLFGFWQTKEYEPLPVMNGIIPKNKFGNVDLFKPCMIPKGAAHIPISGIKHIARKLNIDYGEAVVGFEFRQQRSYPVCNGIVVPEESKEILLDAFREEENRKLASKRQRLQFAVISRWVKLVKGLCIRERIKQHFDSDNEENMDNL